jgi:hypothetical protein
MLGYKSQDNSTHETNLYSSVFPSSSVCHQRRVAEERVNTKHVLFGEITSRICLTCIGSSPSQYPSPLFSDEKSTGTMMTVFISIGVMVLICPLKFTDTTRVSSEMLN